MKSTVQDIAERILLYLKLWEELCPEQNFAEMTRDQFKQAVQASLDARTKLASLDAQWSNTMAERKAADIASAPVLQRFVNAVKAHPKFGDNSGLYTALGYVPKNQRSSGLTRRREAAAAKAPAEAG